MLAAGFWFAAPLQDEPLDGRAGRIDPVVVASVAPEGSNHTTLSATHAHGSVRDNTPFDNPLLDEASRVAFVTLDRFDHAVDNWPDAKFWVKKTIKDGTTAEPLWLLLVMREPYGYVAEVSDMPKKITSLEKGQRIHLTKEEVIDWRVEKDAILYGAFTSRVRLLRENTPLSRIVAGRIRDL